MAIRVERGGSGGISPQKKIMLSEIHFNDITDKL